MAKRNRQNGDSVGNSVLPRILSVLPVNDHKGDLQRVEVETYFTMPLPYPCETFDNCCDLTAVTQRQSRTAVTQCLRPNSSWSNSIQVYSQAVNQHQRPTVNTKTQLPNPYCLRDPKPNHNCCDPTPAVTQHRSSVHVCCMHSQITDPQQQQYD